MIRALIIVESCFGNTRILANAVATGLEEAGAQVRVLDAPRAAVGPSDELDLLVLAAPTHNRGLPTPASRDQAQARGAGAVTGPGLREWLEAARIPQRAHVVVFDTVAGRNWLNGSAAKAAAKLLARRHGRRHTQVRSFLVTSSPEHLAEGQEAEALAWGRELATL